MADSDVFVFTFGLGVFRLCGTCLPLMSLSVTSVTGEHVFLWTAQYPPVLQVLQDKMPTYNII